METESTAKNTNGGKLRRLWRKGESGNPHGRPRGSVNLTNAARRVLKQIDPNDPERRRKAELVVEGWIREAAAGNGTALKELLNRIDGVVPSEVKAAVELRIKMDI